MMKKSQIQMFESIAVVIIIVFIIFIAIAFWGKQQKKGFTDISKEAEELSVVDLAKVVAELPELKCYTTESVTKVNCFDWHKILALNASMHSTDPVLRAKTFEFYKFYFKNSRITFQEIYPQQNNVTVYDNNVSSTRTLQVSIPIVIERKLSREGIKSFGFIVVEGYYR